MSKLSADDVLRLARLARLQLTSEEVALYQQELSDILDYVEQLNSVDTEGLTPTYQVTGLVNQFREDEVRSQVTSDELLKNVPRTEQKYIKTNRMIQ